MYVAIHVKYPLFLCNFERNLISLDRFSKSTNFMRILAVGAELLHEEKGTDGRTDRCTNIMKLIVAFRNLAKKKLQEKTMRR